MIFCIVNTIQWSLHMTESMKIQKYQNITQYQHANHTMNYKHLEGTIIKTNNK